MGNVMDAGALVALVVLLVLLVALVLVLRVPVDERRARIDVVRAGLALRRARAAHASLVRTAERGVRSAERQHSSQLAALDRRIVALEDPRGVRLDSLGPVTLHALRIVTPAGEVDLDGVEATVDSAGALRERKRTTFTRLAVGAATFGAVGAILALGFPKRTKVDDRELYLLIEAGAASCVLQVDPDDGARVRAFATQIDAAASLVAERRTATARELAEARAELAAVREDHSAMDAARERLAEARADAPALARIAAAERELAQARGALAEVRGTGP
jgi:hypothetical protein